MSKLLSNGRLIALAIALIVVAGASAVSLLPRLEDPSITNRFALIITHLPGASAERTEALISERIESELREMSEIKHIISSSRAGISAIAVTLADRVGAEQTQAIWAEVRDKVTSLSPELSRGASVPTVDIDRGHTYTWIAALVWKGREESADMYTLGRYAKELASQLRNLPGTDFVGHTGRAAEEVQVKLDIVKAAAVGLDVQKVAAILAASDAKVAAGELNDGERRLSIEIEGGFSELERIRRVPLLTFDSGGSLQLQDIAEVYIGENENPRNIAIISGQRGVTVNVRMLPTVRGDQWTQSLKERVALFSASLPDEIEVQELFVQERYNAARLGDLVNNILLGFSFIFVILLFTMGIRSAVVVVVSLPLTMLFSLACMRLNGIPIHQMSVTGLIVALGIMVDNAIVVT
ncbi:MAG: efflux RND transporter permease subunit, partial [Spongiibacteraceae bacterium]